MPRKARPVPVSAAERRYILSNLARLAQTDVQVLWTQAEQLSDVDFAAFVVHGYPDVVDPYIAIAADFAADWFEESDPESDYVAVTAPLVSVDRLRSSAQWALGAAGVAALDRLAGTTQRAVFDGARDTTLANVARTGATWERQVSPEACDWCQQQADDANAFGSHDHCQCQAVEVR